MIMIVDPGITTDGHSNLPDVVPENLLQDVRINRRRNVVAVELKQTGDRDTVP